MLKILSTIITWCLAMHKSLLLSTVSLFAALFFIVTEFTPGIPLYGLSAKSKIQVSIVLIPIYGLVLGPYLGALSTFLGVVLATLYPKPASSVFSYMNIFSPTIGTLIVGIVSESFLAKKTITVIKTTIIFFIGMVSLWLILPVGRMAFPFILFHIFSFILIILYFLFYEKYDYLKNTVFKAAILSLSGIITDHFIGSFNGLLFFSYIVGMKTKTLARIYISVIPFIVIERTIMIMLATIFTASVIKLIPKSLYIRNK